MLATSPKGKKGNGKSSGGSKPKGQSKGDTCPEGQKPCHHFDRPEGCSHGDQCRYWHPRLTREENRCFNCGSRNTPLKTAPDPRAQ